ncbi:hypothetical protein [Brevibacillus sp. SAFN-007a]|uniref:hypothetical protein n=1 Tax=Brevibacillus sp. SAFN-007a TaxID=3436862 RepID=UPI003F7DBFF8
MFTFKSPVGLMKIYPDPHTRMFALAIGDTVYGHYPSAIAAADDVYTHSTGCFEWDELAGKVDAPTDIYEWNRV